MKNIPIILASASPRRKELLSQGGYTYHVCPSTADEQTSLTDPAEYVTFLAKQKATEVSGRLVAEDNVRKTKKLPEQFIVLGADTVVAYDGMILGKPKDEADAYSMLSMLSGKTHQVYTGVCITYIKGKSKCAASFFEKTDVTFYSLSHEEITNYIKTGEPMDKAGSYGIQGMGGLFVKGINGDYNNVVGLPLARVYHEIEKLL